MKKPPCPFCKDTGEFKGEPCTTCARAAEVDYRPGCDPKYIDKQEKLKALMMAGKN